MLVAQTGYTIRASSMTCSRAIDIIGNGIGLGVAEGGNHVSLFFSGSGREHLAWILAVEVRQGTLGVDGRG